MCFVLTLLFSTLAPNIMMEAIKVFVTNYNFTDLTYNELHYTGLTFKREQVEAGATICFHKSTWTEFVGTKVEVTQKSL